jgi:hypothetical protein
MARAIAILGVLGALGGLAGCSGDSDVSRTLGARCDSAKECEDRCLPPTSFPGGFCSTSCERSDDCESGASCADTEGGVCLFECVDMTDCAFLGEGWGCSQIPLREDPSRMVKTCNGLGR